MPAKTQTALHELSENLEALEHRIQENEEQSRLAALYQVSRMLGSSLHLQDVLNHVMDAVIELTGAERGFILLRKTGEDDLEFQAGRNIDRENLAAQSMEVSLTVIQQVLETGEGILTTNAQKDPRFSTQDSVISFALRSIMCAPLQSRGETIGVVYVDNRYQSGLFQNADLNLMVTFAAQAAVTIENARLYTQTDQTLAARIAELETLTDIVRAMNSRLNLNHVIKILCEKAMDVIDAVDSWAVLFSPDGTSLLPYGGPQADGPIPLDHPLFAGVIQSGELAQPAVRSNALAKTIVPIHHGEKMIGMLVLETTDLPGEDETAFLMRLASQAASPIENARLYQAVQDANQEKSKFVSVVSHELRLPMTSIKGYTDLIYQEAVGEINEQQRQFLDIVRNNVDRMRILVSDLSDISRIETGKLRLEPISIPLYGFVEQVQTAMLQEIEEREQILSIQVPRDLPRMYADPNRIVQILTNLVSNASKYTPTGGTILVVARQIEDFLRVEVEDNGIGISEEDQALLFSQFFRSEDPKVREQPGWGLGLNVTRYLVEAGGGEIGLESEVGRGSLFWFTVPIATEEAPAVG
jgi:signal transduction histidine kinase